MLGQNTSQLQGGTLVRPEHGHALGSDVGVDISADWNQLIPSDKATRRYIEALWDDPRPEIGRIQDAARTYVVRWALDGIGAGVLITVGVTDVWWLRRHRLAA